MPRAFETLLGRVASNPHEVSDLSRSLACVIMQGQDLPILWTQIAHAPVEQFMHFPADRVRHLHDLRLDRSAHPILKTARLAQGVSRIAYDASEPRAESCRFTQSMQRSERFQKGLLDDIFRVLPAERTRIGNGVSQTEVPLHEDTERIRLPRQDLRHKVRIRCSVAFPHVHFPRFLHYKTAKRSIGDISGNGWRGIGVDGPLKRSPSCASQDCLNSFTLTG